MPEFVIHALQAGGGVLAISPMPGRTRHYYTDWLRLLDWAPDLVITMTPRSELERKGSGTLGSDLANAGISWQHVPVADFGTPDVTARALWPEVEAEALDVLAKGGKVLVHCYGGCGRSGMAVLRIMRAAGEGGEDALTRLRAIRPCAVETDAQMDWAMGRNS